MPLAEVGSLVLLVSLMRKSLQVGLNRSLVGMLLMRVMLSRPLMYTPNRVLVLLLQLGAETVSVVLLFMSPLTMLKALSRLAVPG